MKYVNSSLYPHPPCLRLRVWWWMKKAEVQVSSIPGIPNGAVEAFNDEGCKTGKSQTLLWRNALPSFNQAANLRPTYRVAKLNACVVGRKPVDTRKPLKFAGTRKGLCRGSKRFSWLMAMRSY